MKPRPVRRSFNVKARHLKDWARDQAEMARDFFGTQTPLFAVARSVEENTALSKAVHRALLREFHGHVKFTTEIPRGWRCVALAVRAEASRCSRCGEAAKNLKTNFAYLDHGKVVPAPETRATPAVCPTCGHVEEPAYLGTTSGTPEDVLTAEDSDQGRELAQSTSEEVERL